MVRGSSVFARPVLTFRVVLLGDHSLAAGSAWSSMARGPHGAQAFKESDTPD